MEGGADKIKKLIAAGDALKDAAKAAADHVDLDGAEYGTKADLDDLSDAERNWNRAASVVDPADYPC